MTEPPHLGLRFDLSDVRRKYVTVTPHSYPSPIVEFIDTEKQRLATLWLDHPEGPGRDAIGRRFTRASKLLDQAIRGYVPS